jgi:hypothetical protein
MEDHGHLLAAGQVAVFEEKYRWVRAAGLLLSRLCT